MIRFILKRLIMLIPVMIGISLLVFTIMTLGPGSPARSILGPEASDQDIAKLEAEMGLDRPVLVQYVDYVAHAVTGDFGESYQTGDSVMEKIATRFPVTLKLAIMALILASAIGITVGIISATRQYSLTDNLSTLIALAGNSFPNFWLGMILIFIFSFKLNLVPSFGIDSWTGYILPAVTLSVSTMCVAIRMTRSSMLEVIRQDYIRTARGKGVPERVVVYKHALNNSLIPVITVVGNDFGYLLGGTVVIENVFSIPGMGTMLISAIRSSDTPVVMGGVILLAFSFSMCNLLVDILYAFIDPRIKAQYKRK